MNRPNRRDAIIGVRGRQLCRPYGVSGSSSVIGFCFETAPMNPKEPPPPLPGEVPSAARRRGPASIREAPFIYPRLTHERRYHCKRVTFVRRDAPWRVRPLQIGTHGRPMGRPYGGFAASGTWFYRSCVSRVYLSLKAGQTRLFLLYLWKTYPGPGIAPARTRTEPRPLPEASQ